MQLDTEEILRFGRESGQLGHAQQASPDRVATDQHGRLLARHGINVQESHGKFPGGGVSKRFRQPQSFLSLWTRGA
jgi:hypothetical protein